MSSLKDQQLELVRFLVLRMLHGKYCMRRKEDPHLIFMLLLKHILVLLKPSSHKFVIPKFVLLSLSLLAKPYVSYSECQMIFHVKEYQKIKVFCKLINTVCSHEIAATQSR